MRKNFFDSVREYFEQLRFSQAALLLIFLGLAAYFNAVAHPFVHDDIVFIRKNPFIADLNLRNFFLQTSFPVGGGPLINQYYRPMLELCYRLLYRVFEFNPYGYHFVNVLLHIANSILVYQLVNLFGCSSRPLAFAAAAFFLVHPVQSEAVACVAGISNLVLALLALGSFSLYIVSERQLKQGRKLFLYFLSLLIFFAALLTKEQAVVFPLLIVLYEVVFRRERAIPKADRLVRVSVFFVLVGGYFLIRSTLFGHAVTPSLADPYEYLLCILSIPRQLLMYLGLIFFPHGLHYYRSIDILQPFWGPAVLLLFAAGIFIVLIRRMPKKSRPLLIFGLGWFIIAFLPMLNIIPLVNEYSFLLASEHFLYVPILGMLLFSLPAAQVFLEKLTGSKAPRVSAVLLTLVTVLLTVMTIQQNGYWKNEIALFERTLQFEKNFGRVRMLLAKAYLEAGRYEESLAENRKALSIMRGYEASVENEQIKDFYFNFIKDIHLQMAFAYEALGEYEEAVAQYKKISVIKPLWAGPHRDIALNYLRLGNLAEAIHYFERAVDLNPEDLTVVNSLAVCYKEAGRLQEAEPLFRYIVQRDPESRSAKENLQALLMLRQSEGTNP